MSEHKGDLIERGAAVQLARDAENNPRRALTSAGDGDCFDGWAAACDAIACDIEALPVSTRYAELERAANAVYDSAVLIHEGEGNVHISMSAAAWDALVIAVNAAALATLDGDAA